MPASDRIDFDLDLVIISFICEYPVALVPALGLGAAVGEAVGMLDCSNDDCPDRRQRQ